MAYENKPLLRLPQPFDNVVAAVSLGSESNQIGDHLDVNATLNHGSNSVRIALNEGGYLEIDCKLRQSLLKFSWVNCRLVPSNRKEKLLSGDFEKIQREFRSAHKAAESGRLGGKIEKPSDFMRWLSLSAEHARESTNGFEISVSASVARMQVHFAGNDSIFIQENLDGSSLNGVLLNFSHFGRFQPIDPLLPFMIGVEVLVSEGWLFPLNPRPINLPDHHLKRWRTGLLRSRARELHSDAFNALLTHLVTKQLQRDPSSQYATLAVDALLALPHRAEGEDGFALAYLPQAQSNESIQVPMHSLLSVVEAQPEDVLSLLQASNVDDNVIREIRERHFHAISARIQSDSDLLSHVSDENNFRILIVEDEPAQLEVMAYNVEQEGYEVVRAKNGEEALLAIDRANIDLILLDWILPDIPGIEICRRVRQDTKHYYLPIIMISARSEEVDRVRGLETGANDYISKPYSVVELLSRIRVQLRDQQSVQSPPSVRRHGDITIDEERQTAKRGSETLVLDEVEFRLLSALLARPGEAISYGELIFKTWGSSNAVNRRTLGVYVGRLRSSLCRHGGKDPIRTVRGSGYAIF